MEMTFHKVGLEAILPLRALFLEEVNQQVRYNAVHERGWSDSYLLNTDGRAIGYGSIHGREIPDRDTVFEFFVIPSFRKHASNVFAQLLAAARPAFIECQSNDPYLSACSLSLHAIFLPTSFFLANIQLPISLFPMSSFVAGKPAMRSSPMPPNPSESMSQNSKVRS